MTLWQRRYTAGIVAVSGIVAGKGIEGATKTAGKTMQKIGETWSGGNTESKGAEIIEKTGSTIEKIGNETARRTDQTAKGAAKTIETITGNLNPQDSIVGAVRNSSIRAKEEPEEENISGNETYKESDRKEERQENRGETHNNGYQEGNREKKGNYYQESKTANTEKIRTTTENREAFSQRESKDHNGYRTSEGVSSTANRTAATEKSEKDINSESFADVHSTGTDYSSEKTEGSTFSDKEKKET